MGGGRLSKASIKSPVPQVKDKNKGKKKKKVHFSRNKNIYINHIISRHVFVTIFKFLVAEHLETSWLQNYILPCFHSQIRKIFDYFSIIFYKKNYQ